MVAKAHPTPQIGVGNVWEHAWKHALTLTTGPIHSHRLDGLTRSVGFSGRLENWLTHEVGLIQCDSLVRHSLTKRTPMPIRFAVLVAMLWSYSGLALAAVPEIDGALSIQALSLLGGVLYLLKRKK